MSTRSRVHFHVDQALAGEPSHPLGSNHALRYPTPRPTFQSVDDAIGAVAASAFDHWGHDARRHVETALADEVGAGRQHRHTGAVTGWAASSTSAAVWRIISCACLDGVLAEIFTISA